MKVLLSLFFVDVFYIYMDTLNDNNFIIIIFIFIIIVTIISRNKKLISILVH